GGIAGACAAGLAWRYFRKPSRPPQLAASQAARCLPALAENRSQICYAWRGPAMLVLDTEGCAGTRPDDGLFFRQTRYLRDLRLELFGESPHCCSMAEIAPNEMEFTYVYPEKPGGGSDRGGEKNGIRYRDLDLRLRFRVRANGLLVSLRITNRWLEHAAISLAWRQSADFADYSEVFGDRKQRADILEVPAAQG